ncbi:Protein IMPACT-like protein [Yarrowia sp. C11]|nr:Protein IMPACT-like protein [Yarrowia sp. E02]KAG5373504.1 Protein IMPACT-like protein [Yarrowia sp. C11]
MSLEEEVETIDAIFPDSLKEIGPRRYTLSIPDRRALVQLSFPSAYPDVIPEVQSTEHVDKGLVEDILGQVYMEGEVVLFSLIQEVQEVTEEISEEAEEPETVQDHEESSAEAKAAIFAGWTLSDPVVDRKSIFVAHAFTVHSAAEAEAKINHLKQDKKIARATHNITAYRILRDAEKGIFAQDCDDDGEDAAGGRLLHLLSLTGVENVVVVVARWYGGIKLGPDRFKHINGAARDALEKGGYLKK